MQRFLLTAVLAALATPADAQPRVSTPLGTLEGVTLESGVRTFRGVPYAQAPVRDLRWKAPQPPKAWAGVRKADRFAAQCMQGRPFGDMVFRNDGTSEDCLYLNVWTPAGAKPGSLPVLVYFYGGGFVAGDGSEYRYDGASMAKQGIVVVTMSYRLGIFSWFTHPALSAESPRKASGNYGLLDQQASLAWVQKHIAAFGGDPKRVTIAGESAGSMSVSAQMASPLSRTLIAGAIGESGALLGRGPGAMPLADAEKLGVQFANAVGAKSLADLRAMSSLEIMDASNRRDVPRFNVVVDGWFFPESPNAIYAAGKQAPVPLMAGWNSQEMSGRALLREFTTAQHTQLLQRTFGKNAAEAASLYAVLTDADVLQAVTDLAGDQFIAFGTWKWLEAHARSGQPTYRYYFTKMRPAMVQPPATPGPADIGAVHSAEIEYAMGNLPLNPVYAWTPDDHATSKTMQGYFVNFIKTGNPNGGGLPEWPRGDAKDGKAMRMVIDAVSRAAEEPRRRYEFLDRVWR